jgi:hypothetical protein
MTIGYGSHMLGPEAVSAIRGQDPNLAGQLKERWWFDGLICEYPRCRLWALHLVVPIESHSEEQQSGDDNDIAGGCTWLFGVRQESGSVRHVLGPAFGFAGRPFLAGSNYSDRLL